MFESSLYKKCDTGRQALLDLNDRDIRKVSLDIKYAHRIINLCNYYDIKHAILYNLPCATKLPSHDNSNEISYKIANRIPLLDDEYKFVMEILSLKRKYIFPIQFLLIRNII
nr:hypothetical protein [uncultured Butyrivibrio sp.]